MPFDLKEFLIKVFFFILPIVVMLGYVDYRLGHTPIQMSRKKEYIEAQLSQIQVLVVGSSHSLAGIRPGRFSCQGFNLSNASQSLFYDSELVVKYLDRMPNLQEVIFTISYFSLGWWQPDDSLESWRDYFYYRYFDVASPRINKKNIMTWSSIALFSPTVAQNYLMDNFQAPFLKNLEQDGWDPNPGGYRERLSEDWARMQAMLHTGMIKWPSFSQNVRYLDPVLGRLKQRGIKVAFVMMPVLATYAQHTHPEVERLNREVVMDLCARWGCRFLDLYQDPRFSLSDFADSDHLNPLGAEKLTQIIDDEIVSGVCAK